MPGLQWTVAPDYVPRGDIYNIVVLEDVPLDVLQNGLVHPIPMPYVSIDADEVVYRQPARMTAEQRMQVERDWERYKQSPGWRRRLRQREEALARTRANNSFVRMVQNHDWDRLRLSAQEQRHRDEYLQRQEDERLWREVERREREARERSRQLLLTHLSEQQRRQFETSAFFDVETKYHRYRIHTRTITSNIERLSKFSGAVVERLCAFPQDVPQYDVYLAQKLALETDEVAFYQVAVRHTYAATGHGYVPPMPLFP